MLNVDSSDTIFLTNNFLISSISEFQNIYFIGQVLNFSEGTKFTARTLQDDIFLCSSELKINKDYSVASCDILNKGYSSAVAVSFVFEYRNEIISEGIGVIKNNDFRS